MSVDIKIINSVSESIQFHFLKNKRTNYLERTKPLEYSCGIIHVSANIKNALHTIDILTDPDLDSGIDPIVYGPSGTGKELVVKYFSKKLDRSNIVVIDCAQRSDPGIISSQIFGSKFGDYTGAVDPRRFH